MFLIVAALVWMAHMNAFCAGADADGTVEIRLLFTNNANGKLMFCNCPTDTLGGLGERVGFIREYRSRYDNVLLFDAGGYFGLSAFEEKGKKVVRLMEMMDYDAAGVGDQELFYGLDTFTEVAGDWRETVISASIGDTEGRPVFDAARVFEVDGVRIGVTGISSADDTFRFVPEERKDFTVAEPRDALRRAFDAFDGDVDAVVVLSQLGYNGDREFAGGHDGIDIIAGSHSQTLLDEPAVVNGTWIVQAGKGGGRIIEIVLTFENGSLADRRFRMTELTVPANEIIPAAASVIDAEN